MDGILMPKLAHNFKVFFISETAPEDRGYVQSFLDVLKSQVVMAQLPKRVKLPLNKGPGKKRDYFNGIGFDGNVAITIEDDAQNLVAKALDIIEKLQDLKILVSSIDHEDRVLEAYLYTDLTFVSEERSNFDYRPAISTTSSLDQAGAEENMKLTVAVTVEQPTAQNSRTQMRKITFTPKYAQYHMGTSNANFTTDKLIESI